MAPGEDDVCESGIIDDRSGHTVSYTLVKV
jgi:hypothetical protein